MAQGIALSAWQVEQIRAAWLLTGSAAEGARMAGCNPRTAQRYVREHAEDLAALAARKPPDLAEALAAVAARLLAALFDGKKIADASLPQVATALGIVIDKRQILTGGATARHEVGPIDPGRLTPDEREQAARIRAKLAAEVDP